MRGTWPIGTVSASPVGLHDLQMMEILPSSRW